MHLFQILQYALFLWFMLNLMPIWQHTWRGDPLHSCVPVQRLHPSKDWALFNVTLLSTEVCSHLATMSADIVRAAVPFLLFLKKLYLTVWKQNGVQPVLICSACSINVHNKKYKLFRKLLMLGTHQRIFFFTSYKIFKMW